MNIAPQTIFNDIIDELNVLRRRGVFMDKSTFAWAQIKRKCENLCKVEAHDGWCALGMLYTIAGDSDEMKRCFENALKLGGSSKIALNYLSSLAALGFHQEALARYEVFGKPETGNFSEGFSLAMGSGGFLALQQNIDRATSMGIDMSDLQVDLVESAASMMVRAGITDDHVARHLEAAGEVLRDHKIFDVGQPAMMLNDDGDMYGMTMVFFLHREPADIFAFNVALAEKECALAIEKHPAFDVAFSAH